MDLLAQLDHEWRTLPHTRASRATFTSWQLDRQGWRTADDIVRTANTSTGAAADACLQPLARLAPTDTLAARTLLQAVLPGIRALVGRSSALAPQEDLVATAVGEAWARIVTYPVSSRPERIAANVLLDAQQRIHRASRPPLPPRALDSGPQGDFDIVDFLDLAHRALSESQATLILRTRLGGVPVREVAAEAGCTPAAVRERRRRAERQLRLALGRVAA
jgi:DNA-directed RNA polymerase specialized sigma24 family protein